MTEETPDPTDLPQRWIVCAHCGRGELSSRYGSRICQVCLPEPDERLRRALVVADRVRRALWRAAWGPKVKLDVPREPGDGPVPGQDRR